MYDKYLVTGATGFLGRAVAEELVRRKAQVHALVLHDDPYINLLPKEVHTVIGDVCAENSLTDFFADADGRTCVIHCAGIVSVASRPGSRLYQVNVGGTWRVLRQCMEHDVGKMVYVSSVHAIPEKPKGCIITEDCEFSPGLVDGLRQEQGNCNRVGLRCSGTRVECQHCFPLRHHRAGRLTGWELHLNGKILSCREAAFSRSRRI